MQPMEASPEDHERHGSTPLSDKKLMRGVAVNGWRIESSEDHILDTRQLLLVRSFKPAILVQLPLLVRGLNRDTVCILAALDAAGQPVPERLRGPVLRARLAGQPQAVRLRLGAGDGRPHGARSRLSACARRRRRRRRHAAARSTTEPRCCNCRPQHLPEGVFGENWLQLVHEESGVCVRFDVAGALMKWVLLSCEHGSGGTHFQHFYRHFPWIVSVFPGFYL